MFDLPTLDPAHICEPRGSLYKKRGAVLSISVVYHTSPSLIEGQGRPAKLRTPARRLYLARMVPLLPVIKCNMSV